MTIDEFQTRFFLPHTAAAAVMHDPCHRHTKPLENDINPSGCKFFFNFITSSGPAEELLDVNGDNSGIIVYS